MSENACVMECSFRVVCQLFNLMAYGIWHSRLRPVRGLSVWSLQMAVAVLQRTLGVIDTTSLMVCHARVWIGTHIVQLVSYGNAAVQIFDWFQQLHIEKGPTCWHAAEHTDCWSAHSLSAMDGLTQFYITNRNAKLWAHWSQPFRHRPQGETLGVLDTLFWHATERTQQQTLYLSPMVCSSYKKGSGHSFALHPSQVHDS